MHKLSRLTAAILAVLAGTASAPLLALGQTDDSGKNSNELEEVIVTARFREETLQDIGASIAAYDQDQIERSGMEEVQDLALRTVGLEVLDFGPNKNDVNIRGITNALPSGSGLKALATTFVDDVAVSGVGSGAAADFNMFDFNRVEVLRGPQPTYFGEGSVGGTVRYFSADPELDSGFTGMARAGISSTKYGDSSWRADAATTIPLAKDRAALRVSAFYQDEGGFIDTPNLGTEDSNSFENSGGRLVGLFEPTENFTARLAVHVGRLEYGESYEIDPTQDLTSISEENLYSLTTAPAENTDDFDLYSAKLTYDFGNFTIESVTGYFDRAIYSSAESSANTVGFAGFFAAVFGITDVPTSVYGVSSTDEETFSQEFRFVSEFDGPVNVTGGLYYKDSVIDSVVALISDDLVPFVVPRTPNILDNTTEYTTEQVSAFVEFNWDVTDRFRLIGGARYVNEDYTTKLIVSDSITFAFLGFDPTTGYPQFPIVSNFTLLEQVGLGDTFVFELGELLPRFGAEYDLSEDKLLYFNAARGLRNGGLNQIISAAAVAIDPEDGSFRDDVFRANLEYGPDSVDTFEVGYKSRLNDDRMTLNTALFYSKYKDPQVLIGVPTASIKNAPDEDIWGVEIETFFLINDNWTAFANASWLNAEFTASTQLSQIPGLPPDYQDLQKGNRPNNTPEWTSSVGADFNYPIGSGNLSLIGQGSFSYVDDRWGSVQNFPSTHMGSMEIVNLRIGIQADHWEVTAYVNNLLNDLELQGTLAPSNGAYLTPDGTLDANISQAFINRPLTAGLQLSVNW